MALYNKEDAIDTMILFYLRKMIKKYWWDISCVCKKILHLVIYLHCVTILSVCWQNGDKIDDEKDDVSNGDNRYENDYVCKNIFPVINYKSRGVRLKGVTIIL